MLCDTGSVVPCVVLVGWRLVWHWWCGVLCGTVSVVACMPLGVWCVVLHWWCGGLCGTITAAELGLSLSLGVGPGGRGQGNTIYMTDTTLLFPCLVMLQKLC